MSSVDNELIGLNISLVKMRSKFTAHRFRTTYLERVYLPEKNHTRSNHRGLLRGR